MNDKVLDCEKIESDINEIDEVLNTAFFDRTKAENIIVKHNATDETVAAINSPLSPHYTTFDCATDDMVKNNLLIRAEGFIPRRLRRNKGYEIRLRYLMRTTYLDACVEVC